VRDTRVDPTDEPTFNRFPTWMWANAQVLAFVEGLRGYNLATHADPDDRVGFYGLDLYSLYSSIHAVIQYLDEVDREAAAAARTRYGCLTPWETDPAAYGASALSGKYHDCESEVIAMLQDVMAKRVHYAEKDGRRYLNAIANARLIRNAERYYRIMYYGGRHSWNLRDQHMFDTLAMLLEFHGPESKAIVWGHNSHVGDASATQMSSRGEHNVGQLCRERFGRRTYNIGFGTHTGVVAAASEWGGPIEFKRIRPSHPESYERICHESLVKRFLLPLQTVEKRLRRELSSPRLERAIGVIYRPETELHSHYFQASLPRQFDEFIWFDETNPVSPLGPESGKGLPDTFPFGL
jgi:protein-L-isoaspartate(D-aspartate) O-methyltransferase